MHILVTGATGYIGSVVTEVLIDQGHSVVALDNLQTGHRVAVHPDAVRKPINSYGESKLMFERVLEWYHRAYGFRSISLRYFNTESQQAGTVENVLSLGELHIESGSQLQQGDGLSPDLEISRCGIQGSGKDLEQGGLPGAIGPYDPQTLSTL